MATMVISSTAIMKIAAQKAALQNLRSQIKFRLLRGKKSPMHDSLRNGRTLCQLKYCAQPSANVKILQNHILYGIVRLNYAWIKRSVTEPDISIDKEYKRFLLFSFYYARHQITSIRNSGNPALVFQHLSFQSYHVIHQQEHNTVDWRTVEKTQQN